MQKQNKKPNKLNVLLFEAAALALFLFLAESLIFTSTAGAATRAGGFLAKAGSSPAVYFISANNYKLAVPSERIFKSYGYKWSQVRVLSEAEIFAYPDSRYISENMSAAIYFLDAGTKRYVTQAAASALGIRPEEIISVNRQEFRSYASGPRLEESEARQQMPVGNSGAAPQAEEKCVPDPSVGGEDGCALYYASVKNDPALCAGIKDANYLPACYAIFEAPAGQAATFFCEKISDARLKEICYGRVAVRKKDSSLCSAISTESVLKECAAGVGIVSGELDKCRLLPPMTLQNQNSLNQDTCVYMYAIMNLDPSACEQMQKGSAHYDACVKYSKPSQATQ